MTSHQSHPWKTLLWDLDGTITDPRDGIIGAYTEFLREAGHPVPPQAELRWVIGPPLRDCMAKLLGTNHSDTIEQAVIRYRHWYVTEGLMYRDTPYEGIRELLTDLEIAGFRMFVATAKAHTYGRLILRHWGLEDFFEDIHGSELDGTRSNKADLLRWMLEQYNIRADTSVVMIGDRSHDAVAAKANNLTSIGVGYGYGSLAELKSAGIDHYCASVEDLGKILLSKT
jgi:phosphoglycolate phosphatase